MSRGGRRPRETFLGVGMVSRGFLGKIKRNRHAPKVSKKEYLKSLDYDRGRGVFKKITLNKKRKSR
jgi:hypothetical protein